MRMRPILMNEAMVRATLDGRKTQTRRIIKPQPSADVQSAGVFMAPHRKFHGEWAWLTSECLDDAGVVGEPFHCPLGLIGDRLWVRETWADVNSYNGPGIAYKAGGFYQPDFDGPDYGGGPSYNYEKYPGEYTMWWGDLLDGAPAHHWRPAIHMPRWAARIILEITDIYVERLQSITEDDAKAEGAPCCVMDDDGKFYESDKGDYRTGFAGLWQKLYGTWDQNPFVWVLTYRICAQWG